LPEKHQVLGLIYNNLAEAMRKIPLNQLKDKGFHYNNIKELYENVIKIWTSKENENDEIYEYLATLYNNYGMYLFENLKEFDGSLEKFRESYTLRLKILLNSKNEKGKVENSALLSIVCNNIALTLLNLKKFDESEKYFDYAVKFSENFNKRIYLNILNNIIFLNLQKREHVKLNNNENIEKNENNLVVTNNNINNLREKAYLYSKNINKEEIGVEVATSILNYSILKYEENKFEEAEKLMRESLNIILMKLPEDNINIAIVSINLATLLKEYKPHEKEEIKSLMNRAKNYISNNYNGMSPLMTLIKKFNF
jgi:tetratricopeptide (TPR) repeat protein